MNRATAIAVLGLFAAGAFAVAWWGWSDISAAKRALRSCGDPVTLDMSAFWFLGLVCVVFFPALAVVPDRLHRLLFTAAIVVVFALPFGSYLQFKSVAEAQSYDLTALPAPFWLQEFSLTPMSGCLERG